MNKLIYIFLGVLVVIIIVIFISKNNDISIYGNYICTHNDNRIILNLNKDKTFEYNNINGTYTYVKVNDNKYAIDFDSEEFKNQMEFSIKQKENKQGKLMMLSNNEIYDCMEE